MTLTRREFLRWLGGLAVLGGVGGLGTSCAPTRAHRLTALADADALVIVLSDTHSAYERYPQLLAAIDGVRAHHPHVPLLVAFNGDLFDRGNVVALRGGGRVDLALVESLARRATLVFNLGNHEGALSDLGSAVSRIRSVGALVVSNAVDARSGQPLAERAVRLELAGRSLAVVGLATNDLATYRPAVRDTLRVPDGPAYAAENLGRLLGDAELRLVLSHEGTQDDREMLPAVPDGTLLVGGHDHVRYTHRAGATVYLHTGSWAESVALVGLRHRGEATEWSVRGLSIDRSGPADAELAALVRTERREHLRADDRRVVGRTARELGFAEAALLAAAAVRDAARADVAALANTTFGTGLPAGAVQRHQFDAHVRFDGDIYRAELDGASLRLILSRANQFGETPFELRTGEYLIATGLASIEPARVYGLATTDWVVQNSARYLGQTLAFARLPDVQLKAVVAARLAG